MLFQASLSSDGLASFSTTRTEQQSFAAANQIVWKQKLNRGGKREAASIAAVSGCSLCVRFMGYQKQNTKIPVQDFCVKKKNAI